jgi:hypothetical protein
MTEMSRPYNVVVYLFMVIGFAVLGTAWALGDLDIRTRGAHLATYYVTQNWLWGTIAFCWLAAAVAAIVIGRGPLPVSATVETGAPPAEMGSAQGP